MRIYLIGCPGPCGGANVEALDTLMLWKAWGMDVHVVPTWGPCPADVHEQLTTAGINVHFCADKSRLADVEGLAGSIAYGCCNQAFAESLGVLRDLDCPTVWSNCMTFLFDHERIAFREHGTFDAFHYQSEFQRSQLEPELKQFGYEPTQGHLIRGAFEFGLWDFAPREHFPGTEFFLGKCARADAAKWSSNQWPIMERIQYAKKRAILMGIDERVQQKLGKPPWWADCLPVLAIPIKEFYARLHCFLAINGGAAENWPRVGLECFATGVPMVTQDAWGWKEQIIHGETGYLAKDDQELAHYAAILAHDETTRKRIATQAYVRLCDELASPDKIWQGWEKLFNEVTT